MDYDIKHWRFFFFADYIYFPLFGTKEIRFKHYFWIIGKKTFWVDYVLYRISFFLILFLGCGAGVVSRIYYTIIFLGGGACLSAKGNRKTNSIFSLFLSIGGMKEIRLMICFIFLRLGKKKHFGWTISDIYIYIHTHLP